MAALAVSMIAGSAFASDAPSVAGGAGSPIWEDGLAVLIPVSGDIPPMPVEFAVGRFRAGRLVELGEVEIRVSEGALLIRPRRPDEPLARAVYYPPENVDQLRSVTFEAREGGDLAVSALNLEPSLMGRVEVKVTPESLIKTPGAAAIVMVRTLDASGEPSGSRRPHLTVNVGSLGELEATGTLGEWSARYEPGPARYPEVAVFSAFSPWPHDDSPALTFEHATLPLAASIDLPGAVRPRVRVTVEIAGKTFGPVTSDRLGLFEVPVVVPPGHGVGRGRSADRFGNLRETAIDLRLPPTNRITGFVHPTRLVADGAARARLVILSVDAHGTPTSAAEPRVEARLGSVGSLAHRGEGVFVGWYVPPAGIESDGVVDTITLALPDDPGSRAELELTLVSASPSRIEEVLNPAVVPAPSEDAARVELRALDDYGSPVSFALVRSTVQRGGLGTRGESGTAVSKTDSEGVLVLEYRPPEDASGWEDRMSIQAGSALGKLPAALIFDESRGELAIVDALFRPVAGAFIEIDGERRASDGSGRLGHPGAGAKALDARFPNGAAARLLLPRDSLGRTHGVPSRRLSLEDELALPLMEPVAVNVEIELASSEDGAKTIEWRVTGGEGEREVSIQAGGARPMRMEGRRGEMTLELEPGDHVMVVDIETGISALLLVP